MKISGEQIFSVPEKSFIVGYSAEGYTLNYSADGVNFTAYEEATPANETLIVNGSSKNAAYKLVGNESDVYINW